MGKITFLLFLYLTKIVFLVIIAKYIIIIDNNLDVNAMLVNVQVSVSPLSYTDYAHKGTHTHTHILRLLTITE